METVDRCVRMLGDYVPFTPLNSTTDPNTGHNLLDENAQKHTGTPPRYKCKKWDR